MTLLSVLRRLLLAAPALLLLGGCFPLGNSPEDERKDPHYLAGMSRLSSMDYQGAIAAFEDALVSNPKSAAAHQQLGFLYEEKRTNYAAAIYHFERHLELSPKSNLTDTIRQHILACKLELAKTVPFALVTRQVQEDIRKLNNTNTMLLEQVKLLKEELAAQAADCSNRLAIAAQVSALRETYSHSLPDSVEPQRERERDRRSNSAERLSSSGSSLSGSSERSGPPAASRSTAPPVPRTHQVRPGETLAIIARRYNLKLSTLQNANPRVDARHLKAGQVINIPATRD